MNTLISYSLFLITWQNLLLFLFCFEWWVLSLIDWLVYVTIILTVFSSVNVAHAKSGSTIPQNSGLTLRIFGITICGAWRMFCFAFVVVQVTFWWQPVLFFKRNVTFFCFNFTKICYVIVNFVKRCCNTWNSIFSVSSMKVSVCNRFTRFFVTIVTLLMLRCRLHLRFSKFHCLVLHTKSCAVDYHQLLRKGFHQNYFFHQKSFGKIQLFLVKKFFLTFFFHYLSFNLKWKIHVTETQTSSQYIWMQFCFHCSVIFSYWRIQKKFSSWLNTEKQ